MESRTVTPVIRDTLKSGQQFPQGGTKPGPFRYAQRAAAYRRNFILQRGGVMTWTGEMRYRVGARVTLLPHLMPTPASEYGATVPARALAER